jgi:hypothetical protein
MSAVKVLHLVRRRASVGREEFGRWWWDEIAGRVAGALGQTAGAKGYVQNLTYSIAQRFSPTTHRFIDEWDAIDEYWFSDAAAADAAFAGPSWAGGVETAQAQVADLGGSVRLKAREVVLSGEGFAGEAVKVFIFIAPKPGLTQQRFFEHWTHIHGPLWRQVRDAKNYEPTLRSVQNYLPVEWNPGLQEFGWFGITEGWHRTLESMGKPFSGVEHDEIIVPDANKFTDRAKVCDALVREFKVF